ncbi:cytoplasmic polyadenylation element-binding protein-like isoform X1 [Penaeus vannamei]|uniref:cytoplasmic polyadenylation element-binding protein-like isoform X1 n=1 Tax=Penaeus vannamei TaxID=6689 RepID=UPI000F68CE22|nr:cytoplasmic polyadenylation element-binding protein-like isoform X1 [Penaeus vannamei]
MPNVLNDLTDLYGSLNLSGVEQDENNLEAIMRINSFLNNSLDLRNLSSENAHKNSIDAMLTELMNGTEASVGDLGPVGPKKNGQQTGNAAVDPSIPLSRLLAQSYSYSSDSSTSPHTPLTPRTTSQVCGRNNVFSYMDDSPHSSGSSVSRHSFNYSPGPTSIAHRMRASTASEPGSPTLEDAILMGCQDSAAFPHEVSANKAGDITAIADLVSSLNLGANASANNQGNHPAVSVTRQGPLLNVNQQQLLPNAALFNLQQQHQVGNVSQLQANFNNNSSINPQNALSQVPQGVDLTSLAQLQNAWLTSQLFPGLMDGTSLLSGESRAPGPLASLLANPTDPYSIEKAAKMHRNAAAVCDATCTWSGQLPTRVHKNPIYSCKVFLGGVPWDVTEAALKQTFLHFGNIQVEWPGKENSANPPRGYVYILFEHEKQVKSLLSSCSQDFSIGGNYYYKISSRRIRQKEVQIIPWVISDSNYVRCPSYQLDPAKTVFVGALHGMLSAEGLANIMNDLFGGVVYSGIDTDKHKYPIGSGRVTFNNVQSYRKAVRAAFIEIKTPKFTKKVQVDPYLADSLCQLCQMQQGPYFCRDENCFKYFCRSCWQLTHPMDAHGGHKPLMRNSKLRTQTTLSRVI